MKRLLICLCVPLVALGQPTDFPDAVFNKLRSTEAGLTAFFTAMPKGGDLHHHFSGSIYAETYLKEAIRLNVLVNRINYLIDTLEHPNQPEWVRLSNLPKDSVSFFYNKLIESWSVKDFVPGSEAPDIHFFNSFPRFGMLLKGVWNEGLLEIKRRALYENVGYIETILQSFNSKAAVQEDARFNGILSNLQQDTNALKPYLDTLFQRYQNNELLKKQVEELGLSLPNLHRNLQIDDDKFMMRYQVYVNRTAAPVEVFAQMIAAFESAQSNPLVVGVNIVAPENNPVALRDYRLHMAFFKYCKKQYPQVNVALHAGELNNNQVAPETLGFHIAEAVQLAGANRIGHGTDIVHETNSASLMEEMAKKQIAVEINLTSNEFILGIRNDAHPILEYRRFGVPLVICTDDAGVLRSSLTTQFVLLAKRYPSITYAEIKQMVINSIQYSFIKSPEEKKRVMQRLMVQFKQFEQSIVAAYGSGKTR